MDPTFISSSSSLLEIRRLLCRPEHIVVICCSSIGLGLDSVAMSTLG